MSETDSKSPPNRFIYDPDTRPELFDGILSKRIIAFVVDAILIVALMIPAILVVLVLGFVTLGIGWLLFPPLFAIVALALRCADPGWSGLGDRRHAHGRDRDAHLERAEDVPAARHHARPDLLVLDRAADAADPAGRPVHLPQAAPPRHPAGRRGTQFRPPPPAGGRRHARRGVWPCGFDFSFAAPWYYGGRNATHPE